MDRKIVKDVFIENVFFELYFLLVFYCIIKNEYIIMKIFYDLIVYVLYCVYF